MAVACLVKISPRNRGTGSRVDIYVSSRNDRRMTGLNGQVWEPAMIQAPQLGISLWNGDFTASVDVARATIPLNMEVVQKTWPGADGYMWTGAPVEIYAEEPGTAWPWTKRFAGKVSGFSRRSQVLSLVAEADKEPFSVNVLGTAYAGTGGAEGGTDLNNRPKPLIIGWAQNVEPILIDATNSVYQFSGYGAIEAVSVLYERGSDFGASSGDYANYTALVAAALAPGTWATCLASGMIRLGAPAYGVITGDVKGHKIGGSTPRLPGSVINALVTVTGISTSLVNLTTLASLDTAVPYPINLSITEQTTFLDLAQKIALSCNWQAGISLTGLFFASSISLSGSPAMTLNAQGKAFPQVVASDEADVSPPYWKTILGANRSWRVHTAEEVALATTAEETAVTALLLAQTKGKVTIYPDPWPSFADSAPGDTYVDQNGVFYTRVGGLGLLLGGYAVTVGGFRPIMPWMVSSVQPAQTANWPQITGAAKPEDNADVTSSILGLAEVVLAADYTGAITTALPKVQSYKFSRNGVDLTASAAWSVQVLSGTVSASIGAATGDLSLAAVSGTLTSASLRITAIYSGTTRVFDVKVTVERAAAPVASGGTSSGSFSGSTSSTALTAIGPELTITVGSSGTVALSAYYDFDQDYTEPIINEYARWYRWNGSAYVAIGSEVMSTWAAGFYDGGEYGVYYNSGFGSCNFSDTGRSVGATEKYRLYMRNDTGTHTRTISGNCSAVSS